MRLTSVGAGAESFGVAENMSKRSGDAEPKQGGGSKRPRSLASMAALASLESPEMVDAIQSSSDLRESKKTVAVLESLLNKAELRVANLEIWEKQKGLRYKGKDAVVLP